MQLPMSWADATKPRRGPVVPPRSLLIVLVRANRCLKDQAGPWHRQPLPTWSLVAVHIASVLSRREFWLLARWQLTMRKLLNLVDLRFWGCPELGSRLPVTAHLKTVRQLARDMAYQGVIHLRSRPRIVRERRNSLCKWEGIRRIVCKRTRLEG